MPTHVSKEKKEQPKDTAQRQPQTKSPNLTGIPDGMKTQFENMSGFSYDDVKVHYNSPKPARLQALAYTQGNQVHIGPGQEQHLGHELGHVAQQKAGMVQATRHMGGVAINDDAKLEQAADGISRKLR